MTNAEIIELAKKTLDRGLVPNRDTKIVRATYGELLDFAHRLYDIQVVDACIRADAHREATKRYALIASMVRAGAADDVLAAHVRNMIKEPFENDY